MARKTTFQIVFTVGSMRGLDGSIDRHLRKITRQKAYENLPPALLRDLKLVLVEGVTNAIRHGGAGAKKPARVVIKVSPRVIEMAVEDSGPGFSMKSTLRERPRETDTSGRGLWILKNLVDRVQYERGRPNRLRLIRNLTRPKKIDAALELFDALHRSIQQLKPMKQLYDQFLDFVVDLFNVERASLLVYDGKAGKLKVATSRGIAARLVPKIQVLPGEGISGYVFQTARPLLVHNSKRPEKGTPRPRGKGYQSGSFISVPVIASPSRIGEQTIGVLNLTDKRDGSRFSPSEIQLLGIMAGQAASAFRIRDLIDTVKSHEGINKEFEIVEEIQNRLLPQSFPKVGDFDVGAFCKLSSRGGGDYYDLVAVDDVVRGVIADVSGHHVGSAITMASFRSIFRSLVYDPHTPGSLLQALRWALHEDLVKLHQFISCWVVEIQKSGAVRASGAGHPPLLHYKFKQKKWLSYDSEHLPLGLEDETEGQNLRIYLDKRDCLFFYTDGLFDPRMRETGFDKQRFCEIVEANLNLNAQQMVDKIIAEVGPHQMAIRSPDDVALLLFRRGH